MNHKTTYKDARILIHIDDMHALLARKSPPSSAARRDQPCQRQHVLSPLLQQNPRLALQLIFFLLGIGTMIPWNAFTNAKEYLESRTCHNMESMLLFLFSSCMVVAIVFVLMTRWILSPEPMIQNGSITSITFMWIPLYITTFVMILQSLSVLWKNFPMVESFVWLSLAICGLCNVLMSAGCVACACCFPSDVAMNPHFMGQSMAGVILSIIHYVTAWLQDSQNFWDTSCEGKTTYTTETHCNAYTQIDWGVFGFFFFGSLLLMACILGLSCIDYLKEALDQNREESDKVNTSTTTKGVELLESPQHSPSSSVTSNCRSRSPSQSWLLEDGPYELFDPSLSSLSGSIDCHDWNELYHSTSYNDMKQVLRSIRDPTACIYITFVVSITMFPVWTSELASIRRCLTKMRWANDLYSPLTFLLFNLGDFVGRLLVRKKFIYRWTSKRLFSLSLWRVLFVPLLLSCPSVDDFSWFQLQNDILPFLLQFSFGCSHGLLVSTSFACSPALLPKHKNDTMVTNMSEFLLFALAFGLLSGSICSFSITWLIAQN